MQKITLQKQYVDLFCQEIEHLFLNQRYDEARKLISDERPLDEMFSRPILRHFTLNNLN